jgi:hypothetical protein
METCHVATPLKPGTTVKVPTLDELGRMVERELVASATRQYKTLCANGKLAAEEVANLTIARKTESERLAEELKTLKKYKDLLKKQEKVTAINPLAWAALENAHDDYLAKSAANDKTLALIEEAKGRRTTIMAEILALHTSPGWTLYIEQRKAAIERAAAKAAIAANKCPDANTPLAEAIAAELATEPAVELEVEVMVEKAMTKTQMRKANKSKASVITETVEDVVFDHAPARKQKRQSAVAVAEILGAEGLTAAQIARATKRQQNVEA